MILIGVHSILYGDAQIYSKLIFTNPQYTEIKIVEEKNSLNFA